VKGWRCISTNNDLGIILRWVVSFTPQPLLPRKNSPWYPLCKRLGGPQNRSGRCGAEESLLPCREPNPRRPSRFCSEWYIPASTQIIPRVEKEEKYNPFIADYGRALFTRTLLQNMQQCNFILKLKNTSREIVRQNTYWRTWSKPKYIRMRCIETREC
jgi:hypothetical protein